ncbi:MAG: oligosaccharide flippase family protein [Gemmatimonadetes bacterium]|nr:oligosaccharide flippase family protein [Gemmatimonadota bacterium]
MTATPPAAGVRPTPRSHRRTVLTHGAAWNAIAEVAQFCFNFAAMLVLVRIIAPAEYGKAAAVSSVLLLLNAFSASSVLAHTVQLREGEHPDWTLHWHAAFVLQGGLFAAANLVAGVCWLLPAYRPVAPLLHIGSIGCLLNLPHLFAYALLQRELDFARSRLGVILSSLLSTLTTVALGLAGWGAYAIVIGTHVSGLLPLPIYLLAMRRWRPDGPWFRWPHWRRHGAPLRFGGQQMAMSLLFSARGALEAAVLPGTLGFAALGLLGRAQSLHAQTAGRVGAVLRDTVYPLLPRSAGDAPTFARHATLFLLVAVLAGVAGAAFVGLEGPQLSRLLFGEKWREADPLIWPAVVAALAVGLFQVATLLLQSARRMRPLFALTVLEAAICAPLVLTTVLGLSLRRYAWVVAGAEAFTALVALRVASRHLAPRWLETTLLPPFVAVGLAAGATALLRQALVGQPPWVVLALTAPVYASLVVAALRALYPAILVAVLTRLRGGVAVLRLLRLGTMRVDA